MVCGLSRPPDFPPVPPHSLTWVAPWPAGDEGGKRKEGFSLPGAHVVWCNFALARAMIQAGLVFPLENCFEGSLEPLLLGVAHTAVSFLAKAPSG